MNKIPDRAKMRREYLHEWIHALFSMVSMVLLAILCLVLSIFGMISKSYIGVLGLTVLIPATILLAKFAQSHADKVAVIRYIAPVHKQLPTLPAEEVLLRGSQPSAAAPEELLRPAGKQDTPREELLRAASESRIE